MENQAHAKDNVVLERQLADRRRKLLHATNVTQISSKNAVFTENRCLKLLESYSLFTVPGPARGTVWRSASAVHTSLHRPTRDRPEPKFTGTGTIFKKPEPEPEFDLPEPEPESKISTGTGTGIRPQ